MSALKHEVFEGVYPPSEDTTLLLDCIDEFPNKAIEVCCGAGLVSLKLAEGGTKVLASDLDARACANALHNARVNGLDHIVNVLRSDLLSGIYGQFDAIYCNPPYLPHDDEAPEKSWWYGGKGGVEKVCRLIEDARGLLNDGGSLFLVLSSLSDVSRVDSMLEKNGFSYAITKSRRFSFEEIIVIKAVLVAR